MMYDVPDRQQIAQVERLGALPPGDAASLSGNNAGSRNFRTSKTVRIFCRGGHIENPGQVMFAPDVCGELGNPSIITGASETKKLADINPVHRHAWDIDIQMGIILYPEGEIVSFII